MKHENRNETTSRKELDILGMRHPRWGQTRRSQWTNGRRMTTCSVPTHGQHILCGVSLPLTSLSLQRRTTLQRGDVAWVCWVCLQPPTDKTLAVSSSIWEDAACGPP